MKPCMKQCIKYFYKILQVTVQSFVTCFPISISRAPLLPKLCDSASDLQPPIFMFTWLGWQCLGILYHSKMCCEIRSQLQSTQKHQKQKYSLFPVTDRVWRCLKTPPLFSDDMTIERWRHTWMLLKRLVTPSCQHRTGKPGSECWSALSSAFARVRPTSSKPLKDFGPPQDQFVMFCGMLSQHWKVTIDASSWDASIEAFCGRMESFV